MILYRREALLNYQPSLMTRASKTTKSTKVPMSTIIVGAVLGIVAILLIVGVVLYVRRTLKSRKERLASVPVSKKRSGKDAVHMHVDLEAASMVEEDKEEEELEKPKRPTLVGNSDGDSPWHPSIDGKSVDAEPTDRDSGWLSQIKPRYGESITTFRPSIQDRIAESEPTPPRPAHCTTPSFSSSEVLAMSPPPSYSAANNQGGLLSRVTDVEVFEESRSEIEANMRTIPVPPTPSHRFRSELPPPTPPLGSTRFVLALPGNATPPIPSPKRSSSIATGGDTSRAPSDQGHGSSPSRLGYLKSSSASQTSLARVPSIPERGDLPRLMTVVNTFVPNLEDELHIKIGETVRMLEEFKDGWCTVQYVGKLDAARGAVPRVCLQERKSIVPSRKTSISSLSSAASFRR